MGMTKAKRNAQRKADMASIATAILDSGIPNDIIRVVGNTATSMAQAGAQNPMMAAGTMFIGGSVARRFGLISKQDDLVIKGATLGYLGATQISSSLGGLGELLGQIAEGFPGSGDAPQVSTATQISFDVPDQPSRQQITIPARRLLTDGEKS